MENLINAVLTNYVPTVIITSLIIGVIVIIIAGIIRGSGTHDAVARSNLIIQTVIVGFIMLFVSGSFVYAFHQVYMSHFYTNIEESISEKLPQFEDINDTNMLGNEIKDVQTTWEDPKCLLVVVDTIDCVKKTINDMVGIIIGKFVRGVGHVVQKVVEKFNFNFLFHLPTEVFKSASEATGDQLSRIANFNNLIRLSEIIGLAWVYLLVVTHYFKSIIFSLDDDFSNDFVADIGKMFLGFLGVFLARYVAEAILNTAESFASFLFSTPLANGLTIALRALITDELWGSFGGFGIALVGLAIFVLLYIVLFGFIVFKNARRYFILLVMILLAPIFTPMLFFDMTRNMGMIFWNKFIMTSFSLMFDLIILLMIFVFLSANGLSLGNLLLMLVGMAVVADSNNLIQQIAMAAEVSGFRSVIRKGFKSGASNFLRVRRLMHK